MAITETALLTDLKLQFDAWIKSFCAPNAPPKSFFTGYSGPNLPNEIIIMATASNAVKTWKANAALKLKSKSDSVSAEYDLENFTLKRSRSGVTANVFDFTCELVSNTTTAWGASSRSVLRSFCYHIIIIDAPPTQQQFT